MRANPATSIAAALLTGTHRQHLADVGVRRPRLGVQVVAVVPDDHQPEVVHRRERGRAGADHDLARPAGHGQELAVALRRVRPPRTARRAGRPRAPRRAPPTRVARRAGRARRSASPRPLTERRGDGMGQHRGPVIAGGGVPHGPRRSPAAEMGEERRPVDDVLPRRRGRPAAAIAGGRWGRHLLGGGVTRRHGQPQDVGARSGVPLGDARRQRQPPPGAAPARR